MNNRTAVFDKENDPSVLLAPSAGKLIGYVVEDGAEIGQNEVYAELEVMKMVMQVKVARAGKLIHEKKPGSLLTQGTLIARLELDDASGHTKLEPFEGDFSGLGKVLDFFLSFFFENSQFFFWFFFLKK